MNELMKDIKERDMTAIVKAMVMLTYWSAIIFAEIMFILIMGDVFPPGLMRWFAMFGAVMNGITAAIMPLAKDHYFAPGKMHTVGLALWGIDVAVLFLNVLLAFEVQNGVTEGGMFSWWYHFSPASPLMAVVTWGILMVLSPEHEMRQKEMLRKNRMMDQYAEAEFSFIEDGGVDDLLTAGARTNVRDMAEKISGRKIRVASTPRVTSGKKQEALPPHANIVTLNAETEFVGSNGNGNGNGHAPKA